MANGVVSFSAESTISGANKVVNTWHVKVDGGPSVTEINNLLTPFKTFYDTMLAYFKSGTQWLIGSKVLFWFVDEWTPPVKNSEGKIITPGEFNVAPRIIGATAKTSGTVTGTTPMPAQLALCLSWKTAVASRNARGRTYLGNFSAQADNLGVVNTSLTTIVNNAAGALLTNVKAVSIVSASPYLCVWSPTKGEVNEIVTGSTDNIWDTMRSRVR